MISFIVPLNKRKLDRLEGLFYNISNLYGYPNNLNYEFIIIEQDEEEPFKLGQDRNIGFKKSIGDIVIFLDVDIRLKKYLNFEEKLNNKEGKSLVCWEYITQVNEDNNFNLIETENKLKKGKGKGGCIAFKKENFIKSCGYSNLIIGWGKEDELLKSRIKLERIEDLEIYHVYHKDKREKWGIKKENLGIALDRNVRIVNMVRSGLIDSAEDGYNQTISDIALKEEKYNGLYKHYTVSNIRVSHDFKYIELYKEIYSLI